LDYVREALDKAHASLDQGARPAAARPAGGPAAAPPPWNPARVQLDPRHLERNRIVSFAMSDPNHVPFNHLRTRVRRIMEDSNWRTIGLTSPTPSCGKTMVGLNLALSLARGGDVRTVLVDLDFKRPSVARTLGLKPVATIGGYLRGAITEPGDCFVQVGPTLFVGLNGVVAADSAELIQSARMAELLAFIHATIRPDVVLFDLPPMRSSDDALAFLPKIDAALLVVAAGQTTVSEVDECERQLSEQGKVLGVVLNKSEVSPKDYSNYY
jgi:Mrp family chromosome partitioning ATPase